MPKFLIYHSIWIFTIFGSDIYENRKHIHVGRRGTERLCKIWLEPRVKIAVAGELTLSEQREVLAVTELYREVLPGQWTQFMSGQKIQIIKVN